jgi:Ca2+-binding RTX toxin-like protein
LVGTGSREDWNVAHFSKAGRGVVVDLRMGTAGGQGHDLLTGVNVVEATASADILIGDRGLNVLLGGGGPDALVGKGRGDFLVGGAGDDVLNGGRGNDELVGGRGRDMLLGRAGNDTLVERPPEPNLIIGGAGRDTCRGGYRIPPNNERGCETN